MTLYQPAGISFAHVFLRLRFFPVKSSEIISKRFSIFRCFLNLQAG